jgi:hypothetical protein
MCTASKYKVLKVKIKKRDTKKEEDKLIRLQVKIDKLDALLGNQNDATTRLVANNYMQNGSYLHEIESCYWVIARANQSNSLPLIWSQVISKIIKFFNFNNES